MAANWRECVRMWDSWRKREVIWGNGEKNFMEKHENEEIESRRSFYVNLLKFDWRGLPEGGRSWHWLLVYRCTEHCPLYFQRCKQGMLLRIQRYQLRVLRHETENVNER